MNMEIKEYPRSKYLKDLSTEIEKTGLEESVKKRCENIADEAKSMPYAAWGYITEQLTEIIDLVSLKGGEQE